MPLPPPRAACLPACKLLLVSAVRRTGHCARCTAADAALAALVPALLQGASLLGRFSAQQASRPARCLVPPLFPSVVYLIHMAAPAILGLMTSCRHHAGLRHVPGLCITLRSQSHVSSAPAHAPVRVSTVLLSASPPRSPLPEPHEQHEQPGDVEGRRPRALRAGHAGEPGGSCALAARSQGAAVLLCACAPSCAPLESTLPCCPTAAASPPPLSQRTILTNQNLRECSFPGFGGLPGAGG